ncbi:excisionase, partial [Streptomyces sp. EN23]
YTPGIEDPVSYKEASALLARTGHPASKETVARWVREANAGEETVPVVKAGRTDYVSWTAVLELHRDRTAVKLRASSNW